jgi:hypothetical protein
MEGASSNFDPYAQNHIKKIILACLIFFIVIAIGSFFVLKKFFLEDKVAVSDNSKPAISTSTASNLPQDFLPIEQNPNDRDKPGNIKAENLLFSDFYEDHSDSVSYKAFNFTLPVNIKTDVANYYELSRKISLDPQIDKINRYGYAIAENPFSREADNFFSFYNLMSKKKIPVLITSDFLIYNFQNVLKGVYKEIESEIFYKELWKINKALFEISDAEYKNNRNAIKSGNDPVIEGYRKKAAFFAVMLELLKPKPEQINNASSFDNTKFTVADSLNFDFKMPEYLFDDAKEEILNIREAKSLKKSPIFLYQRDYKYFKIPEEYKSNAKLNNYFLSSKWMNSIFPLFYKDKNCPDCLLDRFDWRINLMTACAITKSFSDNQDIKNGWAKIYKVMSFFNGLRSEVTYLNYQKALVDIFGKEYKLGEIFSNNNKKRDDDLDKLQSSIYSNQFSELEGGYARNENIFKEKIGFRVLQESYWPDNYIFKQLTYPYIKKSLKAFKDEKNNITRCYSGEIPTRCGNTGLDIVNIIYPISDNYAYFNENTDYENYVEQVDFVREKLGAFDKYSWHNNIYWANMDISKDLLESYQEAEKKYPFWENNDWQSKNINTVLGSWANLQLPLDKIINSPSNTGKLTDTSVGDLDYVEPNAELIENIISTADMVKKMLMKLEVIKENDFINKELSRLIFDNNKMKVIVAKEIKGEAISAEDRKSIADMAKIYSAINNSKKSFSLPLATINERVDGIKMMPYIYKDHEKRLILSIGAVFNYVEDKR